LRGGREARPGRTWVYDFKRPDGSADRYAPGGAHEASGASALSGYLRTIIEVSVAHIGSSPSEFIHSLPSRLLQPAQGRAARRQLCLEISPLIIYPIIDRLLGGVTPFLFIAAAALTQIEQRLV
jgi:flagellar motor switch protein FliM